MDKKGRSSKFFRNIFLGFAVIILSCTVFSNALFTDRVQAETSVTAQYPSYSVTYDANGGYFGTTDITTNVVEYYSDGTVASGIYKEPVNADTRLCFYGWYLDKECSEGKEFDHTQDTVGLTKDITVYAKWGLVKPVLRSWTWDSEDDFHAEAYRYNITTAELVDSATIPANVAAGPWDVSEAQNNSVQAWLVKTAEDDATTTNVDETEYHLTIAGNGYGRVFANTDSSCAFYDFANLETFIGTNILDTSDTEYMNYMFAYCEELTALDVSDWKTDKVKTLEYTFAGCWELDALDVSDWKTPLVENMRGAFYDCWDIAELDVSGWTVDSVTDMSLMFGTDLASSLTTIGDVSGWNVSKVEDMAYMFYDCGNLLSVDVSTWQTDSLKDISNMFSGCGSLTTLDVSGWNTSKVEQMYKAFQGCDELTVIDISGWDCSSLDYSNYYQGNQYMFQYCSALTDLTIPASMKQVSASFAQYCDDLSTVTFNHTATDPLTLASTTGLFGLSSPYSSTNLKPTTVVTNNETTKAIVYAYSWTGDYRDVPGSAYTIKCTLVGGRYEGESNPTIYYSTSEDITLINPIRDGYTFLGWTGSNGNVAELTVTVPKGSTGDKSYIANWTGNTYSVVYNANGGSGTMTASSHTYGTSKKLTANAFTRTGYTFTGWALSENGNAEYEDEEYVKNLTTVAEGTVNLYAVWEAEASATEYGLRNNNSSETNESEDIKTEEDVSEDIDGSEVPTDLNPNEPSDTDEELAE